VGPVWRVCCLPGLTPTDRFVRPVRPGGGYVGGLWHARRMPCDIPDARELVGQLDAVSVTELDRYTKFEVEGRTFGYLWEPTATVGLKQTIAEQLALVAERPQTFAHCVTSTLVRVDPCQEMFARVWRPAGHAWASKVSLKIASVTPGAMARTNKAALSMLCTPREMKAHKRPSNDHSCAEDP